MSYKFGQEPRSDCAAETLDIHQPIFGLDIGGANLKAAYWFDNVQVRAASVNFPMWKQPERLAEGVRHLLKELGAGPLQNCQLAVTMTGELADCFATRREGVARIIDQLCQVVAPHQLSIYTVDGQWFTADQASEDPWTVAASNWHALASWLAQWPPTASAFHSGVLVDIGSTTVDILPVINGRLATSARTDRDRLERSQLLYTGVRRTPVCAVLNRFLLDEIAVPVMAELFATVDDAYIVLGLTAEDRNDCDSADGRPRSREHAGSRLARLIGEDAERLTQQQLQAMARQVVQAQATQIAKAIDQNLTQVGAQNNPAHLIYSGHGLPLFEHTLRNVSVPHHVVRVYEQIGDEPSRCAPAVAVGWLRKNIVVTK